MSDDTRKTLIWAETRLFLALALPWWNLHKRKAVRMSRAELNDALERHLTETAR